MANSKRLGLALAVVAVVAAGFAMCAAGAQALSPATSSKAASNVDYSTATFNGAVNPNSLETKTYFQYGPTTSYGSKTAEVSVGAGSTALELAKAVSGLTPNTTYHYRIVATNADGTTVGGDRAFTVGWAAQPAPMTGITVSDVSCTSPTACTALQGGVQRWNGSEWKEQTVAVPAGAKGYAIDGVSCLSSTACTAVGSYTNSSSESKTLVEFWDGTEWKIQPSATPASATSVQVRSVHCSAENACTAVGNYYLAGVKKTLALRWNGTEWEVQPTPTPTADSILVSVSCGSATSCMAVGYQKEYPNPYESFSMVWDGTGWTAKSAVKPVGSSLTWLLSVSCTSSSFCMAFGSKEVNPSTHENQVMVQRWNGSEWVLETTPSPENSQWGGGISCTSSTACATVNYGYDSLGNYFPASLRWNGSEWTMQTPGLPAGGKKGIPDSISCVPSRGCMLVGHYWNASSEVGPLAMANWRAAAPSVTTVAATSVGETSATLKGTLNPNGSETKLYFEYGTTTSYGSKTPEYNAGAGTSMGERAEPVTGLSPNTTYHYRIVANNENPATSKGSDLTFRTTGPPTVSTYNADLHASGEGATLTGSVNPNGLSTTYQFEYGTSPGVYTKTVPAVAESAGSGTEAKTVSYTVTGLTKGTAYYYRITATNSAGKSNGLQASFTTPKAPEATTGTAVKITKTCATLKGTVKPNGLTTNYWFEYGPTVSYGTKAPAVAKKVEGWASSQEVGETVCGLTPGSLYHYRLVAESGLGTANGTDQTFTTVAMALKAGGSLLKLGAPLKVFSSNFTFLSSTGVKHTCAEAELSGAITENPGAKASVTTPKLQNAGGAKCNYLSTFFPVQYSFPGAMAMEYTVDEEGNPIVKTGKFILAGALYSGATKIGECEWEAELSGGFSFSSPLNYTLTGSSTLVKSTHPFCFVAETMSGDFTVTSGGVAVEATP